MRPTTRSAVIAFAAASAVFIIACDNSRQVEQAPGKSQETGSGKAEGDPLGENAEDGNNSAAGKFSGCGFDSFSAETKFNQQTISSANLRFTGTAGSSIFTTEYNVTIASKLTYNGDFQQLVVANAMNILDASPAKARTEAQVEINKLTGDQKIDILSPKKWQEYAKDNDWDDIFCSILPATKIMEQTEAHFSEIEFTPPVPYLISPLISAARFEAEIGKGKSFSDIEAHVVTTTNPKLSNDQKLQGSVTITPADAKTTYTSSEKSQRTVSADFAYRIEFKFGDGSTQIGLNKAATYYIKKGKFAAIIIETGEEKAPFIQFHTEE